jgi:hypothetical protein
VVRIAISQAAFDAIVATNASLHFNVLVRNVEIPCATMPSHVAPILRRVIFIGESELGLRLDLQRVGLHAMVVVQFEIPAAQTLKITTAMAAKVTSQLWEMADMVKVLEDWEAEHAGSSPND